MKETIKAGVLYFVLVFAAGFVLGTIRTLWAVPRFGVRAAELTEAPIMFGVSILAARWVVRHVGIPPLWARRLALGCIALGLMLLVEFTVVLWIRTIRGYLEARDPVSGAATSRRLRHLRSSRSSSDDRVRERVHCPLN